VKEKNPLEQFYQKNGEVMILQRLQTYALTHPDYKGHQDRLMALANLLNAFGEANKLHSDWQTKVGREPNGRDR